MSGTTIKFTLDGHEVEARDGETIWQVAKREGTSIPHLCWRDEPGYRADGNCRACMVEIEGERVLAASCLRKPSAGMVVNSQNERSKSARKMVIELLMADQPSREDAHDRQSSRRALEHGLRRIEADHGEARAAEVLPEPPGAAAQVEHARARRHQPGDDLEVAALAHAGAPDSSSRAMRSKVARITLW